MAIRNLNPLTSLLSLRGEIIFTLNQLKAHPLTQGYVPAFEGLRDGLGVVFAEELALRDAHSAASARLVVVDVGLQTIASRVCKSVMTITADSRTNVLYIAYFRKKSISQWKRQKFATRLDAIKGWAKLLKESSHEDLVALAPEVKAAADAAAEAVKTRDALEMDMRFFRTTGSRGELFDKVNAVRKQTYGELSRMVHEKVGLRAGFANMFFRHESKGDDEAPTLASVDEAIARLERELGEQKKLRKELELKAEEEAKAKAAEATKQAALEELKKIEAEAALKVAEARAKVAALMG